MSDLDATAGKNDQLRTVTREDDNALDLSPSNAPLTQTRSETDAAPSPQHFRTYKRRWFGLLQLALLNIVISWAWLSYSPVITDAGTFFAASASTVNWLSTAFLFGFVVAAPFSLYSIYHLGLRISFIITSSLVLVGSWIRYAGTRANPPSYGAVMVGQILVAFAQPFALSMPTTYSDVWFSPRGRVAATALASLANPLGAALGELVNPAFVTGPDSIPDMTLYVAVICSVASIPSFFLPAKPPTPVAPATSGPAKSTLEEARILSRSADFWLVLVPFSVYVGLFNSFSSLLTQILVPYGYGDDEASLAGGLLIIVGLVTAAVTSPLVDRYKPYLLCFRLLAPIIAACYLTFYWAPPAGTLAAPYVISSVLGAASFALVPVALEALAEVTHPVRPMFSAVLCWSGGQVLGAILIIASDALEDDRGAWGPPGNLQPALILQAVIAVCALVCIVFLGWRGGLKTKRLDADRQGRA